MKSCLGGNWPVKMGNKKREHKIGYCVTHSIEHTLIRGLHKMKPLTLTKSDSEKIKE